MIKVKRAYEEAEDRDGKRYLIDGLWPRGVPKDSLKIDGWLKELAPSPELRRWFNHEPQKWNGFRQKYFDELDAKPAAWMELVNAAAKGSLTLIYSAHDVERNNGVALAEYLRDQQNKRRVRRR